MTFHSTSSDGSRVFLPAEIGAVAQVGPQNQVHVGPVVRSLTLSDLPLQGALSVPTISGTRKEDSTFSVSTGMSQGRPEDSTLSAPTGQVETSCLWLGGLECAWVRLCHSGSRIGQLIDLLTGSTHPA